MVLRFVVVEWIRLQKHREGAGVLLAMAQFLGRTGDMGRHRLGELSLGQHRLAKAA